MKLGRFARETLVVVFILLVSVSCSDTHSLSGIISTEQNSQTAIPLTATYNQSVTRTVLAQTAAPKIAASKTKRAIQGAPLTQTAALFETSISRVNATFDAKATNIALTPTITPSPTNTPHTTGTLEPYTKYWPKQWPLEPATEEQKLEVRNCNLEELSAERYPSTFDGELYYAYKPISACDWATLAFGYLVHNGDEDKALIAAERSFARAININPAFAFSDTSFLRSMNSIPLVTYPDFTNQKIIEVSIDYQWNGIGDPHQINYQIEIRNTQNTPVVTVIADPPSIITTTDWKLSGSTLQSLGTSLTDLIPMESQFTLHTCEDNSPDWIVNITFEDGTEMAMTTNISNLYYYGGPWQTTIKEQNYTQYSPKFLIAIAELMKELELPLGKSSATVCFDDAVFEKAFP